MAMKKLRGMIGMPVVCRGRRVGRLLAAELDGDMTRLKGIWVGAGLHGTRYIAAEELQLLGRAAVISDGWGRRGRMTCAPLFCRAVSTDGARVGVVTGAEIDEVSLAVRALELSRDFWDDLQNKRQRITRFTANRETGEIVVDPADSEREGWIDEERYDQGPDRGHADRLGGGDGLRRRQLADRAPVEPEGQDDRQLDLR